MKKFIIQLLLASSVTAIKMHETEEKELGRYFNSNDEPILLSQTK